MNNESLKQNLSDVLLFIHSKHLTKEGLSLIGKVFCSMDDGINAKYALSLEKNGI